ncbi:hypothetical protein SprV_0200566000 [Sparganum proliferum]
MERSPSARRGCDVVATLQKRLGSWTSDKLSNFAAFTKHPAFTSDPPMWRSSSCINSSKSPINTCTKEKRIQHPTRVAALG